MYKIRNGLYGTVSTDNSRLEGSEAKAVLYLFNKRKQLFKKTKHDLYDYFLYSSSYSNTNIFNNYYIKLYFKLENR